MKDHHTEVTESSQDFAKMANKNKKNNMLLKFSKFIKSEVSQLATKAGGTHKMFKFN